MFQVAQPTLASNTVTLANQRVGGSTTQALNLTNTSNAPAGFQEGLDASLGNASVGVTASGNVTNLAQGANNNSSLVVGVNTATAGARTGTATLTLASNGTIDGLANLALAPQTVNVSGNVYQTAQPTLASSTINLGNRHVGDVLTQATEPDQHQQRRAGVPGRLNASVERRQQRHHRGGDGDESRAGASNNASLVVGMNTATAGARSGTATLNLTSNGIGTSGLSADLALPSQTINVSGGVYRLAQADQQCGRFQLRQRAGGQRADHQHDLAHQLAGGGRVLGSAERGIRGATNPADRFSNNGGTINLLAGGATKRRPWW